MKLTRDEAREVIYGDHEDFEAVKGTVKIIDQGRWSTASEGVFLHKPSGKHYLLNWSQGSTESQDESPFEYSDPDPVEVESKEVTVIEWVPVNAKKSS